MNLAKVLLVFFSFSVGASCKIYDATLFPGGLPGIEKINAWNFSRPMPENAAGLWVLDREDLPMHTQSYIRENGYVFSETMQKFKYKNPYAIVGWYGIIPSRQYWETADWDEINRLLTPLADQVDFVFPSIYTFYDDQVAWVDYAIKNIKQARQYGKKVFPFIWFEYHNSTPRKGQQLSGIFWKTQLETICLYADGVVIWGGWKREFSYIDPWWVETQKYIN